MINWFEIPVSDFTRAKKFYESVIGCKLEESDMMGMKMGMFPMDEGKVSGAIVKSDNHKTSSDGVVVYLNGNPDMAPALSKIEKAGGKVVMPKTHISDEIGYMAFFIDTEGNKLAFHSQN